MKKALEFNNFPADRLKLWKVSIPGNQDDQLQNLNLEDSEELLAINDISDYWPTTPPKKHIHVLVEPPESTTTSSREQELLDRIASLEEAVGSKKPVYGMLLRFVTLTAIFSNNAEHLFNLVPFFLLLFFLPLFIKHYHLYVMVGKPTSGK